MFPRKYEDIPKLKGVGTILLQRSVHLLIISRMQSLTAMFIGCCRDSLVLMNQLIRVKEKDIYFLAHDLLDKIQPVL